MATRMDGNTTDIQVMVDCKKTKGIWASSVFGTTPRPIRSAGQSPTTAHRHTLLVIALTNTLLNISKSKHGHLIPEGETKPRLQVVTRDASFAAALNGIISLDKSAPHLRAGRNFISTFYRQLARFRVTITLDTDPANLVLIGWAIKNVVDAKQIANIPAAFAAVAVSQMA